MERDSQSGSRSDVGKVDRADQPTPVNLTSESSSVSGRPKDSKTSSSQGKVKVRKIQNSIGSVTSTDSGFGQGFERLDRNHSESPQLPPRRRYHQHYHRQHHHGKYHQNYHTLKHGCYNIKISKFDRVENCLSPEKFIDFQFMDGSMN